MMANMEATKSAAISAALEKFKSQSDSVQSLLRKLNIEYESEPDLPGTVTVPTEGLAYDTISNQAQLDDSLASILEPASVSILRIGFDYKHPIARTDWIDEDGMILPDKMKDAYSDPSACYNLSALKAFVGLKQLIISTSEGSPHPVRVHIPRSVWALLDEVSGDWAHLVVVGDQQANA